jgi:ectoine hydroxylase-related dioxygenase (phytanoyl-CoA dioxygenase family)
MSKVLTGPQIAQYERDGYLFPLSALSDAEVSELQGQLDSFRQRIGGKIAGRYNQKPHLLMPWVNRLVRHPRILDAVQDLLGPNIMCWGAQFFAKDAGDPGYVSWHQDGNYWGLSSPDVVTAWVALTPSTVEAGCMNVVPGTHRQRVEHVDTFAEDNLLSRGQEIAVKVDPSQVVPLELAPGQMSLHHVMIFHGSEPNRANHPRVGFAIRYMPPHVHQTKGERDSALLVRGVDPHHHFEHEQDPVADFDQAALAQHKTVLDRQMAILYAGARQPGKNPQAQPAS